MKLLRLLSILLCLFLLPGCSEESAAGERHAEASSEKKKEQLRIPVRTLSPSRDDMRDIFTATATIEARSWVEVHAETAGQIEAIGRVERNGKMVEVREGVRVSAGDELARLDDDDHRIRLSKAREALAQKRRLLEKRQDMIERKLIPRDDLETAEFDVRMAELDVEEAALALEKTHIRAPIGGTITERDVRKGQQIDTGRKLFTIIDFQSLIAPIHIPAPDRDAIAPNMPCEIVDERGVAVPGHVDLIHPTVDPASGTIKVIVALDTGDNPRLHWGDFVTVRVIRKVFENAVVLPKEAVVYDGEVPTCFAVRDGKAHRTELKLLTADDERYAVEGVAEDVPVVIEGQDGLSDGAAIEIVE